MCESHRLGHAMSQRSTRHVGAFYVGGKQPAVQVVRTGVQPDICYERTGLTQEDSLSSAVMRMFSRTPRETTVVDGNPTQLQQVCTDLTVNARDAMPDRGELQVGLSRLRLVVKQA